MVKAAAEPLLRIALTSFVGGINGTDITIWKGDVFAADDPAVRKWPEHFGPIPYRESVPGPRIEQATAAPGEKRGA